jgi:hypothetical protein
MGGWVHRGCLRLVYYASQKAGFPQYPQETVYACSGSDTRWLGGLTGGEQACILRCSLCAVVAGASI